MSTTYTIPLTTEPNNTFQCALTINGTPYTFQFFLAYNTVAGYWCMTISNAKTNTVLLSSIPLVTGCNLLEQYAYMGIGEAYIEKADSSEINDSPDDTNLGTSFVLKWVG